MNLTPELIEAVGKVAIGVIAAVSGLITPVIGFYTWKTRYEVDRLYAKTYRPKEDGSPGPMRKHPSVMVMMFTRKPKREPRGMETLTLPETEAFETA